MRRCSESSTRASDPAAAVRPVTPDSGASATMTPSRGPDDRAARSCKHLSQLLSTVSLTACTRPGCAAGGSSAADVPGPTHRPTAVPARRGAAPTGPAEGSECPCSSKSTGPTSTTSGRSARPSPPLEAGRGPPPGRRLRADGQQHHLRRLRRPHALLGVLPGTGGGRGGLGPGPGVGLRRRRRVRPCAGVAEGTRVYGYFPLADELVVTPGRIDDQGFSDMAPDPRGGARRSTPLRGDHADPVYRPEREDQQMLLWPLFVTSFVVDDFLGDHDLFGARTAVVSSASSKTAIGAAFLLAEREGVDVVGLTSPRQPGVRPVARLLRHRPHLRRRWTTSPPRPSCYIDVAGRRDVTHAVHTRLGDAPPLLDGGRRHPLGRRHRGRGRAARAPTRVPLRPRPDRQAPHRLGTRRASRRRSPRPGTASSPGPTGG